MMRSGSWVLFAACGVVDSISGAGFEPDVPNEVSFAPVEARFVRLVIPESDGQPCIDELEVYGPGGTANLALASAGARASASSLLPGYPIHQVAHLNDGRYGNGHSWIAAGPREEWAQIELPEAQMVAKVVFSRDREGRFADRLPARVEVRASPDGETWTTVARAEGAVPLPARAGAGEDVLRHAFGAEARAFRKVDPRDPLERVLAQYEEMVGRFAARGLDVAAERAALDELRLRPRDRPGARQDALYEARLAKRSLFLRDPDLAPLVRILFVKRHPFEPSHNYSDLFDPAGPAGGAVCVLEVPRRDGRLDPARASVVTLFDAQGGVARDPAASPDARKVYFSWRPSLNDDFHLYEVDAGGGGLRQITDGPFHDIFPCPLPDGGLAFISTRCRNRFLCWRPQSFVLFRMDPGGGGLRPLSFASLSEWTPSVMRDGRILWMRSEYLDKGADFGHTLWAIRPDGTHPELVFGNNTLNCYAGGREVPGTSEILCTLVSHGGDLNGPLALVETNRGKSNPDAIHSITPDVAPHYHMSWARTRCFRDPCPLSHDVYLASHAAEDRFGLYLVDRFGNREVLYLDPAIGSMAPAPLWPAEPRPSLASSFEPSLESAGEGRFLVADVYRGLEGQVPRGKIKYIRVCQEVPASLVRLPDGEYRKDHEDFEDWYATPTHRVRGPYGWPSYVAKADLGLAPVEEDGSALFTAPAGKVLYFEALDADFNEIQRMRSVVQLQPGETRSCIGCHEDRSQAPGSAAAMPLALRRPASALREPPWGAVPFSYEKTVQPVWDQKCVRCHDGAHREKINLTARRDPDGVPASFRTLIEGGWVHYFDYNWGQEHRKAPPLTFGTSQSKLFRTLAAGHHDVSLAREEMYAVKCWVDLNCPLWPDYLHRPDRVASTRSPSGR
jgi:hydrazine synthase alpha subunit-like protein